MEPLIGSLANIMDKIKHLTKDKLISFILTIVFILTFIILFIVFKDSIINSLNQNFFNDKYYIEVLKGLGNTFLITILAFVIGIIIGTIICLIENSSSNNTLFIIIQKIAKIYVSIFRGTPIVVQLLIIYFVIFAGYRGNPIYIAVIAFGLNSGAYVSEIFRGGINAIPKGQMEAGRSLGLSYFIVMRKIIFPQAVRNALPSLGNEFISLIKETSICGFIGAIDLTLAFRKIANATYDFETVYLVMGLIYFIIVAVITIILSKLERRLLKNVNTK